MNLTVRRYDIELGPAKFKIDLVTDNSVQDWISQLCDTGNIWERDTSGAISRILKPGDCFVDVGAHVGWFTLLAASIVGPTGHVIAFEPMPDNFMRLSSNVALNGFQDRVLCIQAAVSSEDGAKKFWINADNSGAHGLYDVSNHPLAVKTRENPEAITVATVTLDDILWKYHDKHPEVPMPCIKIDIEGAEILAFRGAEKWLRAHKTPFVFAEVNGFGLESLGFGPDDMRVVMSDFGYKAYLLEDADFLIENNSVYNVLFSHLDLEYEGKTNAEENGTSTQEGSEEKGFEWQTG